MNLHRRLFLRAITGHPLMTKSRGKSCATREVWSDSAGPSAGQEGVSGTDTGTNWSSNNSGNQPRKSGNAYLKRPPHTRGCSTDGQSSQVSTVSSPPLRTFGSRLNHPAPGNTWRRPPVGGLALGVPRWHLGDPPAASGHEGGDLHAAVGQVLGHADAAGAVMLRPPHLGCRWAGLVRNPVRQMCAWASTQGGTLLV